MNCSRKYGNFIELNKSIGIHEFEIEGTTGGKAQYVDFFNRGLRLAKFAVCFA